MKTVLGSGLGVAILAVAFALILLTASGPAGLKGFPLDDAWIHMVYGRSIAQSGYLAYNEGIPATGSTSPLWAYLLGLIHLFFPKAESAVLAVKVTGILIHGLMAWASFHLLRKWMLPPGISLLGGAFLALSPALATSSISGMEVPLGCALCLLGFGCYFDGRYLSSGIFFGLSGLTRPEYGIIVPVLFANIVAESFREKTSWRDTIRFLTPIAVAGLCFVGWNQIVGGRPFPATFYVKSHLSTFLPLAGRVRAGFDILLAEPPLAGGIIWLGLLGVALPRTARKKPAGLMLLSAVLFVVGQVMAVAPADPEAFYHIRYLLPAVPLFWIVLFAGTWAGILSLHKGGGRESGHPWKRALAYGYAGIFLLVTIATAVTGAIRWRTKFANDCRNINEVQVELGKAIDRTFPLGVTVGTVDAGAVKYFGKRYTIDLVGLNTTDVFQTQPLKLDVLVLMPAWARLSPGSGLKTVAIRETRDYQVTSDTSMGTQIIMVGNSGSTFCPVTFRLLGRTISVFMQGMTTSRVEQLQRELAVGQPRNPRRF
jgi:hypothetical protein